MNFRQSLLAAAMAVSITPMSIAAMTPAAQVAPPPAAASAPPTLITTRSPSAWIRYDDVSMTPVVDDVSRHLAAARSALADKNSRGAAEAMQAAARALAVEADRAATLDRERATSDMAAARAVHAKLAALVKRLDATAAQIRSGKVTNVAELDKTFGKAQRADLERRWMVTDVSTWYPLTDEPQRHFGLAAGAYAKKDFKAAADEVRKGAAFVRLEAARAGGEARHALDRADAQLDATAAALDKDAMQAGRDMKAAFADADRALALAHRAHAAASWTHKTYELTGYELKAAAQGLEDAAAWTGAGARATASAALAEARTVGDKLASGGAWTRDEVAKGIESVGTELNRLGQSIGTQPQATPTSARG